MSTRPAPSARAVARIALVPLFVAPVVGAACLLLSPLGCGPKTSPGFGGDDGTGTTADGGDDGASTAWSSPNGSGVALNLADAGAPAANNGPCKGGKYEGTFVGLYTSHLTGVGVPIPVAGNVDMTLDQAGSSGQMCTFAGESETCSNFFELKDGVITGIADAIQTDAGPVGGFPYFCTMTGTLACKEKKLVDGWIQCTYCVGPLADGGMACELGNGLFGTTGVGGHFAGPLTADYDYSSLAFVNGDWNGAEALAGNDGTKPGPDGGPISEYLSDSGLYLGPGDFGGSGHWEAGHQ
ncbi:MAG: hypothetical protein ACRENE_12665 [Polyangiaceae bacterium]